MPQRMMSGILVLLHAVALLSGCTSDDRPPYYRALVTNVYREQFTLEHFAFYYWWEERGETPFLKPYGLLSKEFIVEIHVPSEKIPGRVTVKTERISLDSIDDVAVELTDSGKKVIVTTRDGRRISATRNFPDILKKDPGAGFADQKLYIQGLITENGTKSLYKLEFDYIKHIRIIGRTEH